MKEVKEVLGLPAGYYGTLKDHTSTTQQMRRRWPEQGMYKGHLMWSDDNDGVHIGFTADGKVCDVDPFRVTPVVRDQTLVERIKRVLKL